MQLDRLQTSADRGMDHLICRSGGPSKVGIVHGRDILYGQDLSQHVMPGSVPPVDEMT